MMNAGGFGINKGVISSFSRRQFQGSRQKCEMDILELHASVTTLIPETISAL